jgi:hypothetical protein
MNDAAQEEPLVRGSTGWIQKITREVVWILDSLLGKRCPLSDLRPQSQDYVRDFTDFIRDFVDRLGGTQWNSEEVWVFTDAVKKTYSLDKDFKTLQRVIPILRSIVEKFDRVLVGRVDASVLTELKQFSTNVSNSVSEYQKNQQRYQRFKHLPYLGA